MIPTEDQIEAYKLRRDKEDAALNREQRAVVKNIIMVAVDLAKMLYAEENPDVVRIPIKDNGLEIVMFIRKAQ